MCGIAGIAGFDLSEASVLDQVGLLRQYRGSARTFKGIRSVPPGHVLVAPTERPAEVRPHWVPQAPGHGEMLRSKLEFKDAAADVPIGAFLSGGVDSSAAVAHMARLSPSPVKTFTIGFEDTDGFDERPYAGQVSQMCDTEHTELVVNPDQADLIERLVWHHDQPFGDSTALPTFLLSELTRGHVTVALSGDGGDQLFGGYERFAAALAVHASRRVLTPVRAAARRMVDRVPPSLFAGLAGSVQRMLGRVDTGLPHALSAWVSCVSPEWCDRLLPDRSRWGDEDYERIWSESSGAAPSTACCCSTCGPTCSTTSCRRPTA